MRLDEYQRTYEYAEACARAQALQTWWKKSPQQTLEGLITPNIKEGDWVWLRGGTGYRRHQDDPMPAQLGFITNICFVVGGTERCLRTPWQSHVPKYWYGVDYEWRGHIGGHFFRKTHYEFQTSDHYVWVPRMDQLVSFISQEGARAAFGAAEPAMVFSALLELADAEARRGRG